MDLVARLAAAERKAPREGTRPTVNCRELQPTLEVGSPDPAIFSQLLRCGVSTLQSAILEFLFYIFIINISG